MIMFGLTSVFQRLHVCRLLAGMGLHHHDTAHVMRLLPASPRGLYLQRRAAFLALHAILGAVTDVTDDELSAPEVG